MDVKVVDASAVAALLFNESQAEVVADQLASARLLAPSILSFELANVCLMKSRRHSAQRDAFLQAFHLRHRLRIEEVTVDHDATLELAAETGLTACDASYLWVARRFEADLVTLDRQLAAAYVASRA